MDARHRHATDFIISQDAEEHCAALEHTKTLLEQENCQLKNDLEKRSVTISLLLFVIRLSLCLSIALVSLAVFMYQVRRR